MPVEVVALLGGAAGDLDAIVDLFSHDCFNGDKFKMDQVSLPCLCFFVLLSLTSFYITLCYFSLFLPFLLL